MKLKHFYENKISFFFIVNEINLSRKLKAYVITNLITVFVFSLLGIKQILRIAPQ